ncbi:hypothetical protein GCM10027047_34720 [Rhodococcus aerolatus]
MTDRPALRTVSLSRRVVVSSVLVLAVVLGAAGVLTDVLLGAQLRSAATVRLDGRLAAAAAVVTAGGSDEEAVAAATGDGVTAVLVTADGRPLGNRDLAPGRPPVPDAPGPASGRPTPPAPPTPPAAADPQVRSRELPDGARLTVAVDTASIASVRSQLRTVLVPLLLGALLVAALLLLLATRTALRPLDRMTALARDITRGERGRRLAPDRPGTELGRTAAAFDGMLDALEGAEARAQASDARTRRFVADAAHELRTPLAGVQAAGQAVLGQGRDAPVEERERLQVLALREAQRASRLVDDLLSLATIEQGLELRRREVDLAGLVAAQAERVRVVAPGLHVTADAAPLWVRVDPERVAQVLANLLDNARTHTPPGGDVGIVLSPNGSGARVLVTDSGPGVPAADRERIFDRLVRLDSSRSRPGSGLGLAIARGLAEAHGGTLRCVEPPAGVGAAFELLLPG